MRTIQEAEAEVKRILDQKSAPIGSLRNMMILWLSGFGVLALFFAWLLEEKKPLWSSVSANLGCELLGSIAIVIALDYIERRRNKDMQLNEQILKQFALLSGGKVSPPYGAAQIFENSSIQSNSASAESHRPHPLPTDSSEPKITR